MLPRMRGHYRTIWVCLALAGFTACGGSTPPAQEPDETAAAVDSPDDVEQTALTRPKASDEGPSETASSEPPPVKEPEFTEGMSVNEAINAVPMDTPTTNLEPEVLAKPLSDEKLYEPCKVGTTKFKLKVAVWDGRAVGVDAITTPKNDKLAECIKAAVRQVTWPDKVRSLNLVEYQF
jgi:hypothetical protein